MIDWLLSLLVSPEAQRSPHYWASVALAHAWLGFGAALALSLAVGRRRGAVLASVAYLLCWELFQALKSGLWADSALDWAAWTLGCFAVMWPGPVFIASLVVMAVGVRVRT